MDKVCNNCQMDYFWKKKEIAYFILSIMVFLIHNPSFSQYENTGNLISLVNEKIEFFTTESVTRYAVPMFFILSGIIFFRDYSNKQYFSKIKSRITSLVIPYLAWNIIWTIFNIICSYTFISSFYTGRQMFELSFTNIFKSIFFYGCNIPFWFIFDLIVFVIISPLIELVVRNKYIGIFSVIGLLVLHYFGIHPPTWIFYSGDCIIFYLLGAVLGKHFFPYITQKSSKKTQYISIAFLSAYIILKNLFPPTPENTIPVVSVIIFILSSFSLWNILDLFVDKIQPRAIYSRSFAIFALNAYVLKIISKLFLIVFKNNEWLAIPNFIITISLTLIFINIFCIILECYFPRINLVLMGNRVKNMEKK